ncbi:MAG: EAL domain-containing protein [Rhizobiales bacterium]|nr:EAL domain-containing protein [Hyphomicrobiales bacterium]
MPIIRQALAMILYIVPSIGIGFGVMHFAGFDPKLAVMTGLIAAMLGAEAHAAYFRSVERRKFREEIYDLRGVALALARDMDVAADRIVEIEDRYERETEERIGRIFAEIRVVEALVKQLAFARGGITMASLVSDPEDFDLPAEHAADSIDPHDYDAGPQIDMLTSDEPTSDAYSHIYLDSDEGHFTGEMINASCELEDGDKAIADHDSDEAALVAASIAAAVAEQAPPPQPRLKVAEMTDAQLLDAVRHALETNRVDLYLQPVVGLPQRKTKYYEALSRLRTEDGELILPHDYMRVAEPAGMMPAVDNILLFRCVQVVRKLVQRNKQAGVFCNISAFSLLDSEFFPQFIDYMQHNKDLAPNLIFEFSQDTVNGAGAIELESLQALADIGFRFSMDHVTNLKLNPRELHDRHFRHMKISAARLLDSDDAGDIHVGDLKELLARNGIQLIADRIEVEREVVNVLDFNVEYGQGFLFGEPRPVREEAMRPVEMAIAAD